VILADKNPVVIKRYEEGSYVGGATIEASAVDPDRFWICMGGADYYASEDSLNLEQATALRDLLTVWIEKRLSAA
jgi:hypothetical protein